MQLNWFACLTWALVIGGGFIGVAGLIAALYGALTREDDLPEPAPEARRDVYNAWRH